jgi:hypothetical protein
MRNSRGVEFYEQYCNAFYDQVHGHETASPYWSSLTQQRRTLKSIEILTVFLKDEDGPGGPSREHVRFDRINSVQPNGRAVVSHSRHGLEAFTCECYQATRDYSDLLDRPDALAGHIRRVCASDLAI